VFSSSVGEVLLCHSLLHFTVPYDRNKRNLKILRPKIDLPYFSQFSNCSNATGSAFLLSGLFLQVDTFCLLEGKEKFRLV